MEDRIVIVNANIITMDAHDRRYRTLAIEDGRIAMMGSDLVAPLLEQGWTKVDLGGKTVLPGFIDTHEHLMLTGSQETAVHLDDAEDIDAILERMAERAGQTEKGAWVYGSYLNEQNITEKTMPTRYDLDRGVPDHPAFIMHATCHMCSLNMRALEVIQPPIDLEGLDRQSGNLTGVIRDPGILTFVHPAMADIVPESSKVAYLHTAADMAIKKGITTVHALDGGDLGPGDTAVI